MSCTPSHGRPHSLRASLILCLLACVTSCKTAARSIEISPGSVALQRQQTAFVEVHTSSFRAGWFAGARIPSSNLKEAIEAAIAESALFPPNQEDAPPTYELLADVEKVEEDEYSLDMTAKVRIEWSLKRPGDLHPTWIASIKTTHRSTPFDSNDMKKRLLLALEGATRKNIKEALQRISTVDLDGAGPAIQSEILAK